MSRVIILGQDQEDILKILSNPDVQRQIAARREYIDLSEVIKTFEEFQPEIDETESFPVLSDEPEDPEAIIENLQARILYLEAELEEHKRSVDTILEALGKLGTEAARGLGTPAEVPVTSETFFDPQTTHGGREY